jgi:hypothetical protein
MNRVTGYLVAAVIATALATVALGQRSAPAQRAGAELRGLPQPIGAYPTRWEFGRFRYTPSQAGWSWRSGNERVSGDALTVYRKLEGQPRPVADEIWYGEVLSALGQQGWEAFMMRDFDAGSEVWFKRPAR